MNTNKLIIKNGLIFDPLNNIEGEKKDILIESGKIVEKFTNNNDVKEIDANGKTVVPSAIDIHTHVASQQINWVRLLGANDSIFKEIWQGLTLENIAKNYISMGYNLIIEAKVFPSLAKQTTFNFQQIPVLDKAMLLNISNFWPLELEFQRGKINEMAIFLSDLLSKTCSYGFKIYNPFESEDWNFKDLREDITKSGRLYNFSALDVYENIIKCVESLGLPHSVQAHFEGYEREKGKSNLFIVLEKIKSLNLESNPKTGLKIKRDQIMHIAHANSYAFDGDNEDLIKHLNENLNFSAGLSFIGFNKINPLITSDRRLIQSILNVVNANKLISSAVEFEGDSFASIRNLSKENYNICNLWANAIDLALNVKNKFQLSFTLNFPNYANITDIPEITTWLISSQARDKFMEGMNENFLKDNKLLNNDEVLNFSDLVCLTRASPAKLLGIGSIKGNLGLGADADINILDININEIDLSQNYERFKKHLENIDFVIKSGKVVKKQNNIDLNVQGNILWSKGKTDPEGRDLIISKKKEFYQKYSSLFYEAYNANVSNKILREIR